MALRLSDIKYVDDKSQKLLNGYLKNIYDTKQDHIIPELVLNICLLFYYQREHFGTIEEGGSGLTPSNFTVSQDKRTVLLNDGGWGTLLGNVKIDSMSDIICRWNLRLRKQEHCSKDYTEYIYLGITGDSTRTNGYFYNSADHRWSDGDLIGIKLDLKQHNIEYFVNGKSIGIVKENISVGEDVEYQLVISMAYDGNSIEIESLEYF